MTRLELFVLLTIFYVYKDLKRTQLLETIDSY